MIQQRPLMIGMRQIPKSPSPQDLAIELLKTLSEMNINGFNKMNLKTRWTLEKDGSVIELNEFDARNLYNQLHRLFGQSYVNYPTTAPQWVDPKPWKGMKITYNTGDTLCGVGD